MDLSTLGTETRNERTAQLDRMPVLELLSVMNAEDQSVALTVRDALPDIAAAVDAITASLRRAGRLIYLGAGTSGRIGLLDAVECPPPSAPRPTGSSACSPAAREPSPWRWKEPRTTPPGRSPTSRRSA